MDAREHTGETPVPQQHQFPSKQCGAMLTFAPGENSLKCPYCGAANEIAASSVAVEELDFNTALSQLTDSAETVESLNV